MIMNNFVSAPTPVSPTHPNLKITHIFFLSVHEFSVIPLYYHQSDVLSFNLISSCILVGLLTKGLLIHSPVHHPAHLIRFDLHSRSNLPSPFKTHRKIAISLPCPGTPGQIYPKQFILPHPLITSGLP